jgi:AcrR family transcriptional regulator
MFHENTYNSKRCICQIRETRCIMNIMARSYRLKRRAERRDQTRQKIIDAAIELHQAKGPARTSMADIAKRAKVGRVTVYRHFPDDETLIGACSGQYFEHHPLPDLAPWRGVEEPVNRLCLGLRETYAYHRNTEAMMLSVIADARANPEKAPFLAHWAHAADVLAEAWPAKARRKRQIDAAIALALRFETWHLLVRAHGLTDAEAVSLMVKMTCDCPRPLP